MPKKIDPYIETKYDAKYDAYYDPKTNEWIESKCDNPDCEFCAQRPQKHFEPKKKVWNKPPKKKSKKR